MNRTFLRWGWRVHLAVYRLERRLYWGLARRQGQLFITKERNVKETDFDTLVNALEESAVDKPTPPTLKERLKDVAIGASLLGVFIIPLAVTAICLAFGG